MADVLNKTTLQYLRSVNTPDYPEVDWLYNPDISGVVGVPSKYWKLVNDVPTEMTVQEKAAVDAVESSAILASIKSSAQSAIDGFDGYQLRALAQLLLDENNALRSWLTDFKAATTAAGTLAAFKTNVAALPNLPLRTLAQVKQAYKNLINGNLLDK